MSTIEFASELMDKLGEQDYMTAIRSTLVHASTRKAEAIIQVTVPGGKKFRVAVIEESA